MQNHGHSDIKLRPIWTDEGKRKWEVLEDITFNTSKGVFTVPKFTITDLGSIPRLFWSILPRDGQGLCAYILHDWIYSKPNGLTRKECDMIMLEILKESGVGWIKRRAIYRGVRMGGMLSWRKHRAK